MNIWDKIKLSRNQPINTEDNLQVNAPNGKIIKSANKIDFKKNTIILHSGGIEIDAFFLKKMDLHHKLINYFTIKIKTMTGYYVSVQNHIFDAKNQTYIFPRIGFIDYMNKHFMNYKFINNILPGDKPDSEFKWTGSFKGNQLVISKHIMEKYFTDLNVKNGTAGVILNLQAGQGKTFLAAGLVEKIQKKTLVVCHNRTIMFQWIEVLKMSYPDNKIDTFYGENKGSGDILVGIVNSLVKQPTTFFNQFGYVILDEVHEYCCKTRKKIYQLAQSSYMLGLSATPDERIDGLDKINLWQCGPILDAKTVSGYTEDDIPFTGAVSMIKYKGHPDFTEIILNKKLDVVSNPQMISQLCEDFYRIYLIVKLTYELRKSFMNIFIFADRRNYLEKICDALNKFKLYNVEFLDTNAARLVGGASSEEIKDVETNSNIILTTYQFMGTGKSIPKMDAIILATPRKSKSRQYINRIFRLGSDYSINRKIIDIVDWSTPMKSQWYKRKLYYDEMKYPINIIDIDYKKIEIEMLEMGLIKYESDDIDKSLTELEELMNKKSIL